MSTGILVRDTTLLPATGQTQGDWLDVRDLKDVTVLRTATGGVYALEIDWSNDGAVVEVTETVVTTNNGTVRLPVGHLFARFRVRNTDAVAAFTDHATVVRASR